MSEILATAFRHNLWANQRMIEFVEPLADDVLDSKAAGAFGTLRDTLVHLFAAEGRYVSAMTGKTPEGEPVAEGKWPGFEALRDSACRSGESLIEMAQGSAEDRIIRGEHPVRGKYAIPISIFFAQAINHATEHRDQANTILTQNGIQAPNLDVWSYQQEKGEE